MIQMKTLKQKKVYAKFYNDMNCNLENFRARIYNCQPQEKMILPIETLWKPKKSKE